MKSSLRLSHRAHLASSLFCLTLFFIPALACNLVERLPQPDASATAAPTLLSITTPPEKSTQASTGVVERPVKIIPMEGPIAHPQAELSGLAWYGDTLILLPQFPGRMSPKNNGALLALPRQDLLDFLDGKTNAPLRPIEIPFFSDGIENRIPGFEGFEALAFIGDQAFITIEASQGREMMGYLVAGRMAPDLGELRLDAATLTENMPQVNLSNKSDETILVVEGALLTFFEVNGHALNPAPHATRFDTSFSLLGTVPLPPLEYRLTDATSMDAGGRFWVMNYYFAAEIGLRVNKEPLASQYGEGPTHAQFGTVERLVELQYSPTAITFTATPPIQLELLGDDQARNWEGLARLEGRGFLMVTDKFPETILGFVAYP